MIGLSSNNKMADRCQVTRSCDILIVKRAYINPYSAGIHFSRQNLQTSDSDN